MQISHTFSDVVSLEPGAVYALPTDTVYGLSCSVDDAVAVEKIRQLKYRDAQKPMIALIASLRDLDRFGVALTEEHSAFLKRVWPGPVSVVFKISKEQYGYIAHESTLAVRMPAREDLRAFITRVGPIVSTSANVSGEKPATTIAEVMKCFPEGVTAAVDTGTCAHPPSTVVQILR